MLTFDFLIFIGFILFLLFKQLPEKERFQRLPKNVLPVHYEISLTPDFEKFTYSGKQNIFVNVVKPTKTIVMNSVDLNIKNAFYNNDENILHSQNITYNELEETVSIHFVKEIPVGKNGFLAMEFNGELNERLNGFYRSKYISDGVTKYAAVTQFAPTDARRCFPCWDEPAVKATFGISLTIPKDMIAISNMPIKSVDENQSNLITNSFERTPLMSTYLVAFIVCDYGFIENLETNKTIRVYAPKDQIKLGEFALNTAVKVLPFFEKYFNIPYPLSKIDLVTVADFSFGAMENWGMITYREAILLVDPENSSTDKKQQAAVTIAHELAHQWFGNLVTLEWWTHLWLNEGYASFMEFLCIDHLYPEFNIWSYFLTTRFLNGLELDSLSNTHPIEVPVEHPSEITEIFDMISYDKGASLIRMIHNYIGDDDFRKGMHLYLAKHSYSNVETHDLWQALAKASKKPIGNIMSTWTKLSGFPLVSITEKNSNNPRTRIFKLSQEKFYLNGTIDKSNTTWIIPISIITGMNPNKVKKIVLDEKSTDIEIEDIDSDSWIKINAGSVGFFRTLYSSNLLKSFVPAIKEQNLPTFDRLNLLDDLFATSVSGHASTVEFLEFLKECKNESYFTVWSTILNNLSKISHIISHLPEIDDNFKKFGRNLMINVYSKLGWKVKENENLLETFLRKLILSKLVEFEDENVINESKRLFQLHVTKKTIIPADFRSFVYLAVLSVGNSETLKTMLSMYRETDVQEEKNRILYSLGAVKDRNILQSILEFSMSEEVRAQDAHRAVAGVAKNYLGRSLAWEYFKNNWEKFVERYQSGTLLTHIVQTVTGHFLEEEIIQDIEEFFKKNLIPGTDRTIKQSIEVNKLNIAWLNRDKELIREFLKNEKEN